WKTISGGNVWRGELHSRRKDGAPFWASAIVAPIKAADGAITHFVGVAEDVTQTRNLEHQLRHAQKMEAVGGLAGGVAHDLHNLLSAIVSFGTLLRSELPTGGLEHGYISEILAAAERASGLTRSLLAFSREQPVEVKPLDVGEAVSGFQRLLGRLLSEKIEV